MPLRERCHPPKAAMFPSPETPSEPSPPPQEMSGSTKVRGASSARTLQALQPSGLALKPEWWKWTPPTLRSAAPGAGELPAVASSEGSAPETSKPAPAASIDSFINPRREDLAALLIGHHAPGLVLKPADPYCELRL